ncbi:shikimate kinase AroK [Sulfuriferula sp. AH1]|uniref:shikimate kinase AroK n=1 Tax=Sulfuriferula sp. AH1 TaxID=1985873 RepID=UPI0012F778E4|nr:shikimate kinase AroK [Sulfuriferula sp. AH1]
MNNQNNNIYLVGLMGSGKTTVGKLLSKQLRRPFYDTDHEIVRRTGVTIPMIFEVEGEAGFRKREEQMIAELTRLDGVILATGGGAIISPANREQLKQHGTVVYLRGTVDELWQRTRHDRNRPLLQTQDPKARLRELYAQRDPLYREIADVIVDTGRQNVNVLVQQLVQYLTAKSVSAK